MIECAMFHELLCSARTGQRLSVMFHECHNNVFAGQMRDWETRVSNVLTEFCTNPHSIEA
jgi:hypothetical protein